MFKIQTLNKISQAGLGQFSSNYAISDDTPTPDAIMLRSASLHENPLPDSVLAIARAGAGVNNIPVDQCSDLGIVVFNTPGANANAVKELVITGLFLSSRKIIDGISWARALQGPDVPKQVEKGKSAFGGPEITGKTLGIIGLGAIGSLVAQAASALGMNVIAHDPFNETDKTTPRAKSLEEIYQNSDYISLHLPLNDSTRGMFNKDVLAKTRPGVRILNFARAALVDDDAMIEALQNGTVSAYVTDFPTEAVLNIPGVIPIPHLGASTPESEENCASMAASQLIDFLENGNITNSVNFPAASLPRTPGATRYCITHRNLPEIPQKIEEALKNAQIKAKTTQVRKEFAYTIIDAETKEDLPLFEGLLKLRII